jgi:hypothetical protein
MINASVYFNRTLKKVIRTDPPGLLKLIVPVEGSSLLIVPPTVFDTETRQIVPVNFRFVETKPPVTDTDTSATPNSVVEGLLPDGPNRDQNSAS